MTRFRRNPASFRDPDASVFHHGDRVLRAFQNAGKKRYDEFSASGLPEKWTAGGSLLPSTPLSDEEREGFAPGAPLLLEHPRIPFLSWCYEWSFEMLRAAALLELDLFLGALEKDFLWREDFFDDYSVDGFESEVQRSFRVLERAAIPGTGRVLYAVEAEGQKSRR